MVSVAPSGSAGTFLWIGDGGRPTYGVVEHFLRWRWPELSTGAECHQRYDPKLYTGWYIWHLREIGSNPGL